MAWPTTFNSLLILFPLTKELALSSEKTEILAGLIPFNQGVNFFQMREIWSKRPEFLQTEVWNAVGRVEPPSNICLIKPQPLGRGSSLLYHGQLTWHPILDANSRRACINTGRALTPKIVTSFSHRSSLITPNSRTLYALFFVYPIAINSPMSAISRSFFLYSVERNSQTIIVSRGGWVFKFSISPCGKLYISQFASLFPYPHVENFTYPNLQE